MSVPARRVLGAGGLGCGPSATGRTIELLKAVDKMETTALMVMGSLQPDMVRPLYEARVAIIPTKEPMEMQMLRISVHQEAMRRSLETKGVAGWAAGRPYVDVSSGGSSSAT